jgi:hypothetical protein
VHYRSHCLSQLSHESFRFDGHAEASLRLFLRLPQSLRLSSIKKNLHYCKFRYVKNTGDILESQADFTAGRTFRPTLHLIGSLLEITHPSPCATVVWCLEHGDPYIDLLGFEWQDLLRQ